MKVLDSSAMMAYIKSEPGGEWVAALLDDPDRDVPVYAHAVNLFEVFHLVRRAGTRADAERAIADLKADGVIERRDLDADFWRDAAELVAAQRGQGRQLAQGDAFGLALARRLDAEFWTSDRHELEDVKNSGLADIYFIR